MSPHLKAFYQAYHAWLQEGAPTSNRTFLHGGGLCLNLYRFLLNLDLPDAEIEQVALEMKEQFEAADLDRVYPFNSSDKHYQLEIETRTAWRNPERVAWVAKHAA